MQITHLLAALSLITIARADCDDDVMAANAARLTYGCMNSLHFWYQLTIAAVFADYRSNPDTSYKYGLCGSAACKAEVSALAYPTCSPTAETSYAAEITSFANDCTALDTARAANGGTCTLADVADNIWTKKMVTLDHEECAASLGKTKGSNWYTNVFTPLDIATPNAFTTAFCETSSCVRQAWGVRAALTSCADGTDSNKNLYAAIWDVLTYCSTMTPAPTTTTMAPTPAPTPAPNTTANVYPQWWPASNTTTARPTNSPTVTPSPSTLSPTAAPASATPVLSSSTQIKMSFGLTCDCTCHF